MIGAELVRREQAQARVAPAQQGLGTREFAFLVEPKLGLAVRDRASAQLLQMGLGGFSKLAVEGQQRCAQLGRQPEVGGVVT